MPSSVLVTGISGNLGRALAKLLHTETRVVGVDRRPFAGKPKDIDPLPGRHPQGAGWRRRSGATASRRSSTSASCTTRAMPRGEAH